MAGNDQLPYLLELLDDESPVVREAVERELAAFGPALNSAVQDLDPPPSEEKCRLLSDALHRIKHQALKMAWPQLADVDESLDRLELGLGLIAQFQYGHRYTLPVSALLDELASEFRCGCDTVDVIELAVFLFRRKGLDGNREDYYNPLNSNLHYVVESGKGIPISLACIYVLTGRRLGLDIEGCNFPGHFMAMVEHRGDRMLVDCFNKGRFLREDQIMVSMGEGSHVRLDMEELRADGDMILARVLRNLVNAYERAGCIGDRDLMVELLSGVAGLYGGESNDGP